MNLSRAFQTALLGGAFTLWLGGAAFAPHARAGRPAGRARSVLQHLVDGRPSERRGHRCTGPGNRNSLYGAASASTAVYRLMGRDRQSPGRDGADAAGSAAHPHHLRVRGAAV